MSATRTLGALLLTLATSACALGRSGNSPRDFNVITREQLDDNHFQNAYEAVQAMRSNWLQTRGPDSFQSPSVVLVYLDNVKLGGINELRSIQTINIGSMRFFNGTDATSRWGIGHSAGVIQVTTFRDAGH